LGVREVYGEDIKRLLDLAEKRAEALQQLFYAEEAFRQAIDAGLSREEGELQIKHASAQLREALSASQEARYPERQEFVPRQQVLDADMARAKALREAIEVWWWRRFSEHVAEFNKLISLLPEEKSLGDAAQSLDKAQTVFQFWSVDETISSWQQQARTSLDEMEKALKKARHDHLKVRLEEAVYWLDEAKAYLPAGMVAPERSVTAQIGRSQTRPEQDFPSTESQPAYLPPRSASDTPPDPFAALACLTRAGAILDGLQAKAHQVPMSSELQNDVNKDQKQLASLREKAGQYLFQWLADERQRDFSKTVQELSTLWRAWQSSRGIASYPVYAARDDLLEFLKGGDGEARARREVLDKIRLHLYLDPAAKTSNPRQDRWLRELVLLRHDCLLRAQQLLREVKARWNGEEKGRRSYIYWAWQKINEAFDLDPDSKEVQGLREEIQQRWEGLKRGFQDHVSVFERSLRDPLLIPEKLGATLHGARGAFNEAKELLDSQVEPPIGWKRQVQELGIRLRLLEQMEEITNQWDDPNADLMQLIPATKSFLVQADSQRIGSYLRKRICDRRPGWSDMLPSLVMTVYKELGLMDFG